MGSSDDEKPRAAEREDQRPSRQGDFAFGRVEQMLRICGQRTGPPVAAQQYNSERIQPGQPCAKKGGGFHAGWKNSARAARKDLLSKRFSKADHVLWPELQ